MTAATYATSTNSTWKHGDRPLLFVRPFGDAAHWLTDVQSVIITTARRRCDDDRESNYDETERHFRCRRLFVFIHNDSVAVALCSIFGGYWGIATPIIEGSSDCSAGSWGWDRRFGIWFILFLSLQKLAEAWCGKCFPWCLFCVNWVVICRTFQRDDQPKRRGLSDDETTFDVFMLSLHGPITRLYINHPN